LAESNAHRAAWRIAILALTVAGALAAFAAAAAAAELVMFEHAGCPWCRKFDREIAPVYPKTPEGQRAPLRRVNFAQPLPPDIAFLKVERITPVFVLVDGGREIGRIRGYPGEDHFWGLLSALLARLDAAPGAAGKP
jgi:hypothetical protein